VPARLTVPIVILRRVTEGVRYVFFLVSWSRQSSQAYERIKQLRYLEAYAKLDVAQASLQVRSLSGEGFA
jgi:hypothetical protein